MSPDMKQYELDRITTLLKSFGWAITGSRFEGEKILVDFDKAVPGAAQDTKEFEESRITNMLKSMGWTKLSSQFVGDKIHTSYEKVVVAEKP